MAKAKPQQDSPNVEFKCPKLEAHIRKALRRPKRQGAITRKDLASLEDLKPLQHISDLTGIEYATNLKRLNISHGFNVFTDITPLAGLKKLTELNLCENPHITDISPLAGLTKLTKLNLGFNYAIVDLESLEGLTKLTELNLYHGIGARNFWYLEDLENLTKLDLGNNKVTGTELLACFPKLTELDLHDNKITDITGLKQLTKLTELDLGDNKITDIEPLAGLKTLTNLVLEYNWITDITPLARLTNLATLKLKDNKITDITPLVELKQLTCLTLDYDKIIDGPPLENLDGQTYLHRLAKEHNARLEWVKAGLERLEKEDVQLLKAAADGDADAVRDLITQGADLRSTDENGTTAWELAATAGHNAVVKVLKNAVSDLGELLADPESGYPKRAPCPICGVFNDVFDSMSRHFIAATFSDSPEENLTSILDDIVFDVAGHVERYIDQGAAQLSSKCDQKGRKKGKKNAREEFTKTIMQSVSKSLAPTIESMVDYGNEWWTSGRGVKKGVGAFTDDESAYVQSYYHPKVRLFARRQKDKALKVMKWLVKQGYGAD